MASDVKREKLSGRLGFLLVSAGCAIGLGNIWRFPYITGQYGGAAFVILYLIALAVLGLPILIMEFTIGRAGKRDIAGSYKRLEKTGQKWHIVGYLQILGCLILMMFYTTVAGWCLAYFYFMATGAMQNMTPDEVGIFFGSLLSNPTVMVICMGLTVLFGSIVCFKGLRGGVERVSKFMMVSLFVILLVLIFRSVTLPGASKGLKFYFFPDLHKMFGGGFKGFFSILYASIGQAFFTLGLGIGSMTIFGSYIGRERSLTNESIIIVGLDTLIAFLSGLVIFPASFSFGVNPGEGAGLAFVTLPNVFNAMALSRLWGTLFFMFLSMAALTTIVTVLENLVAFTMSEFNLSRHKSAVTVGIILFFLSLPTALGFNVLSFIEPLGKGTSFLDLFDFIVSSNLVELGGIYIVIFCTCRYGWGFNKFMKEVNTGKGIKFPNGVRFYVTYILPLLVLTIFIINHINKFFIK